MCYYRLSGFFDSAGSPYYYFTDFQGNNIRVYDKTGKLMQRTEYYASGEPWLEPVYDSGAAGNRYLFGGKERMAGGALNEYDFEARNYVASFQRFTTIDPEAEKFSLAVSLRLLQRQSHQLRRPDRKIYCIEGISTRNAEYYGWEMGYFQTPFIMQRMNFCKSMVLGVAKMLYMYNPYNIKK